VCFLLSSSFHQFLDFETDKNFPSPITLALHFYIFNFYLDRDLALGQVP
jgi:hypothetical protein